MKRREFLKVLAALPLLAVPLPRPNRFHDLEARLATMDAKLFPNGGWLAPAQANAFIMKLIKEPTILRGDPIDLAAKTRRARVDWVRL